MSVTDLAGAPHGPYPQVAGWHAKGIGALAGTILAALLGAFSCQPPPAARDEPGANSVGAEADFTLSSRAHTPLNLLELTITLSASLCLGTGVVVWYAFGGQLDEDELNADVQREMAAKAEAKKEGGALQRGIKAFKK